MKKHCLVLLIQLSILLLFSAMPVLAELPPETRWADPSSVRLDVEFPGNGYHATWDLHRCDCGDLLVRSELSVPGETETGENHGFKYADQTAQNCGDYPVTGHHPKREAENSGKAENVASNGSKQIENAKHGLALSM